jgi:hypothetical protein
MGKPEHDPPAGAPRHNLDRTAKYDLRTRCAMERDIESVVGFFDELGLFLRKSMVDDDFVWRMFLEPAMHYWFPCGEEYVKSGPLNIHIYMLTISI